MYCSHDGANETSVRLPWGADGVNRLKVNIARLDGFYILIIVFISELGEELDLLSLTDPVSVGSFVARRHYGC